MCTTNIDTGNLGEKKHTKVTDRRQAKIVRALVGAFTCLEGFFYYFSMNSVGVMKSHHSTGNQSNDLNN